MGRKADVEKARQLAAELAQSVAKGREITQLDTFLEEGGAYKELKEQIQMARKPRMRTVEQFLCDSCDVIIQHEEDGYIIHGNVYTANPHRPGGLIGNNFPPELEEGEMIDPATIKRTVMCRNCFMKAVGLEKIPVVRKSRGGETKHVSSKVARELEAMLKR